MLASASTEKPRFTPGIALAALTFVAVIAHSLPDLPFVRYSTTASNAEFQSMRHNILSDIDSAAKSGDLDSLLSIQAKYKDLITDSVYLSSIQNAISFANSKAAQTELAASRRLDLTRHQEEASISPDLTRPQVTAANALGKQRLSVLP